MLNLIYRTLDKLLKPRIIEVQILKNSNPHSKALLTSEVWQESSPARVIWTGDSTKDLEITKSMFGFDNVTTYEDAKLAGDYACIRYGNLFTKQSIKLLICDLHLIENVENPCEFSMANLIEDIN